MKIAIISSVLNEINFIEDYIIQNINYVNEILLSDGGSTDGTLEVIKKYIDKGYNIKLFQHIQGKPYTDEWNHDKILNNLINNTNADYIMQIDVDEILDSNFSNFRKIIVINPETLCYGLRLITFWGNTDNIRVNVDNDNHWLGSYKYCIFKNIPEITFKGANHAILHYNNDNIFNYNYKYLNIPLYHLHYTKDKLKVNDNRLNDIGGDYNNPDYNIKESYWLTNPFNYYGKYEIKCISNNEMLNIIKKETDELSLIQSIIKQYNIEVDKLKNDNKYYIEAVNAYKEVIKSYQV